MTNKPEKKPVWQYAKEARERKAALAAQLMPRTAEAIEERVTVQVSNPDVDFNARVVPLNFQARAGLKTYAEELKERLSDIEQVADGTYFMLPVKLPKKVYKQLLLAAIKLSEVSADWTERDQLEALVIFSDAKDLTKVKDEA